jgi:twitching motility protein PilT
VLLNNSATANIIREGRTDQLENVLQSGSMQGMQTLDTTLRRLLDAKLISGNDAYNHARNKQTFDRFRDFSEMAKAIEESSELLSN